MRESQFLCLAASRRDGGNCIAGIDLDSGDWIRPVNSRSTGAFGDHELFVLDAKTGKRKFIAPLDVLSLHLEKHVGNNAQPENWEITPASYEHPYVLFAQFTDRNDLDKLIPYLDKTGRLLHNYGCSVQESEVKSRALTHSLSLVRPDQLHWKVCENRTYSNKTQVRAEFRFEQTLYNLVVTDPVWESRCRQLGVGRYPHSTISGEKAEQVMLTISLAAVPLHGYHYKLVAGVIKLPA
jgi:hypothetical protein